MPSDRPERRPNQANRARGAYGERRAAEWYVHEGFDILDRNWRSGRLGELDIVAGRARLIVFCEVKSRATDAFGDGSESITPVKQARLRRLAAAWLAQHERHMGEIRFDVVSVTGTRVEVYEAAF